MRHELLKCCLFSLQNAGKPWVGGKGGHRVLLQQPANVSVSTNAKLLFLFYKNITNAPLQLIMSGLRSPGYASALDSAGFDANVKVLWTVDEFPFFDQVTSNEVYSSGVLQGPASAPGPSSQPPIGEAIWNSYCADWYT